MTVRIAIETRPPGMQRLRRTALAAVALVLAPSAQGADGMPESLSVSVRAARRMCFNDRVEVTGVLVPRQEVDIPVEREGYKVAQVLVAPSTSSRPGRPWRISPPWRVPVRPARRRWCGRAWPG